MQTQNWNGTMQTNKNFLEADSNGRDGVSRRRSSFLGHIRILLGAFFLLKKKKTLIFIILI